MKLALFFLILVSPLTLHASVKFTVAAYTDYFLVHVLNDSDKNITVTRPTYRNIDGDGSVDCHLWNLEGIKLGKMQFRRHHSRVPKEFIHKSITLEPSQLAGVKIPMHMFILSPSVKNDEEYIIQCTFDNHIENDSIDRKLFSNRAKFVMNAHAFTELFKDFMPEKK